MRKHADLMGRVSELTSDVGRREGVWARYDFYSLTTSQSDGHRYLKAPLWDLEGVRVQSTEYQPLVKYPDLFLRFARLADVALDLEELDSERNQRAAFNWMHEYGALGLTPSDSSDSWGGDPRGGREDAVATFAFEAWAANATLRLYEAATNPNGVETSSIAHFVPERHRDFFTSTPEIAAAWAKDQAMTNVNRVLGQHSCLQIYARNADDRAIEAYDFRDLLGAMYLQAMWLLVADNPGRCRNPECPRILAFEQPEHGPDLNIRNDRSGGYRTRSDKEYCSKNCADAHNYRTVKKPLREAARRRKGG